MKLIPPEEYGEYLERKTQEDRMREYYRNEAFFDIGMWVIAGGAVILTILTIYRLFAW
jgi:hypothetical protein